MSISDPLWQYTNSADTAKTNYLKEKWDKLYPGWNLKPRKIEVPQIIIPEGKDK